jgi:hypothetical protein
MRISAKWTESSPWNALLFVCQVELQELRHQPETDHLRFDGIQKFSALLFGALQYRHSLSMLWMGARAYEF